MARGHDEQGRENAPSWAAVERLAARLARRCPTLSPDDLVQEAFIALQRASQAYNSEGGASFATFAWLAIHRHLGQIVRREWARTDWARGGEGMELDHRPDTRSAEPTDRIDITELLHTLPTNHAQVIRWRYGLDGEPRLSGVEISQRLGVSPSRVVQLHTDALARLRVQLEVEPDPD